MRILIALVIILGAVGLLAGMSARSADHNSDPLRNYYGNTLISERLVNRSGGGGAAHVWLEKDGTYISFDVTTGGRYGTYNVKREGDLYKLCMNYPAPMGTLCYPIESREIGETWIAADPGTFGKNTLVKGHQ